MEKDLRKFLYYILDKVEDCYKKEVEMAVKDFLTSSKPRLSVKAKEITLEQRETVKENIKEVVKDELRDIQVTSEFITALMKDVSISVIKDLNLNTIE